MPKRYRKKRRSFKKRSKRSFRKRFSNAVVNKLNYSKQKFTFIETIKSQSGESNQVDTF